MGLPNFLIVGAPKCGTTFLYYYLDAHPDVFMSSPKEPLFLSWKAAHATANGPGDANALRLRVKSLEAYTGLFPASGSYTVIGEASSDTLYYHKTTAPLIENLMGRSTKILIMIREPASRAFSAYMHQVKAGLETLSFPDALEAEENRIRSGWETVWHYKRAGLYTEQIRTFTEWFPHLKIVVFDDLENKPIEILKDVCDFLGIPYHPMSHAERPKNRSGIPRSASLQRILNNPPGLIRYPVRWLLPTRLRHRLRLGLSDRNIRPIEMSSELRQNLVGRFRDDILKLQGLIGRDLSGWIE